MIATTEQDVVERALSIPEQARAVIVNDNNSLMRANELLLAIKDIRRQIDEAFDPIIKKAHEAHKEAVAQKKRADLPLVEAEVYIKPQIGMYVAEQERLRREEEQRLMAEAQRLEEERRLAEALQAEESGQAEEAEAILDEPVIPAAVYVPPATPKLNGVSIREVWNYRVTNPDKIPREYMRVDEVKIGQIVRALRSAARIPGVRVYSSRTVAAGRR